MVYVLIFFEAEKSENIFSAQVSRIAGKLDQTLKFSHEASTQAITRAPLIMTIYPIRARVYPTIIESSSPAILDTPYSTHNNTYPLFLYN